MRIRLLAFVALLALVGAACDGDDAELSTASTIVTGPTESLPPDEGTTTTSLDDGSVSTTLVGEAVPGHEVVNEIPNDNGVEQHIVIPNGAYTDIDLENFVIDLIEEDDDLFGAEIFDDADAAEAFIVPEADRTEEQVALLERHHFLSLTGRDRIDFRGPFAEFPGGAIGS